MNIVFFSHHTLYTHMHNERANVEQKQNSLNKHHYPRGDGREDETGHNSLYPFCNPGQQMLKSPPTLGYGGLICFLKQLLHLIIIRTLQPLSTRLSLFYYLPWHQQK